MAVPTQAGTDVVIGFGSFAWSGYVAEDGLTWTQSYDGEEIIKAQDGSTRTKIRMDAYEELSGSFILDNSGGSATVATTALAKGDVVSITTPDGQTESWEVQDASSALAAGAVKITVTLRKETSMTYS